MLMLYLVFQPSLLSRQFPQLPPGYWHLSSGCAPPGKPFVLLFTRLKLVLRLPALGSAQRVFPKLVCQSVSQRTEGSSEE